MDDMGCLDNGFHEDNHKEESVRMRSTFVATGKTLRAYTGSILVINHNRKIQPTVCYLQAEKSCQQP